jgi:hypothetical protein
MTAIRFGTGMAVDGGVGVVPPGRVADSKAERRPEPLFVSGPWWFRAISGRGARRVRGGRPWSGGGSVAGLGRAAACPGPGPAVGGPGFAARAGTAGSAALFTKARRLPATP